MKVLYNNRYGGFGISLFAVLKLIEIEKGIIAVYKRENESSDNYIKVKPKDAEDILSWSCRNDLIFIKNHSNTDFISKKFIDEHPCPEHILISHDEIYERFIKPENLRFNKTLIALFEKYGSEKISGSSAELELENIPKGWSFKIKEYDGLESIYQFCPDEDCYYAYE